MGDYSKLYIYNMGSISVVWCMQYVVYVVTSQNTIQNVYTQKPPAGKLAIKTKNVQDVLESLEPRYRGAFKPCSKRVDTDTQ